MATLTITVPDEVAQTIAALPDANRATYLADVNAFAVAWASHAGVKVPIAETANGQATPQYHLLDPNEDTMPFTEADGEALREAYADFDAGNRGKPAREVWANMAAKYGFKNPVL